METTQKYIARLKRRIRWSLLKLLLNESIPIWSKIGRGGKTWALMEDVFLTADVMELLCLANVCEAVAFVARKEYNKRRWIETTTTITTPTTSLMPLVDEAVIAEH